MSRVVVLGASGHIGTYLIPRLVEAGHEVVAVSRGQRQPYQPHGAWRQVRQETLDRQTTEAGERPRPWHRRRHPRAAS